ncbi:MAG: D-erythronate dehydrogenase [Pseudomonadota bacterium]
MRVVILGGGGFLGQKLARALALRGTVRGEAISALVLADLNVPSAVEAPFPVETIALNVTDNNSLNPALAGADVVYHLAAIVSGQAEAEFDLGMSVNLQGSINVFEAARASGRCPVVVFTSSVAAYGGEVPDPIEDWTALNPQTSYGAQKAAAELLLTDFSRKGFLDGRGVRLPTITIRPGKPNAAASSFMSSIFREPLQGETANCPVGEDYPIFHSAPRTVIRNLIRAAEVSAADLGQNRCFVLPGRTDSVGEMIAAMTRVAGPEPVTRITWNPDPAVEAVVSGWRADLRPAKALALGFEADASFDDNVRYFLEDDIERADA